MLNGASKMTDAEYQQLYETGSMDVKTRTDYERYLAMQSFISNMSNLNLNNSVETMDFTKEPNVVMTDENLRYTPKLKDNNKKLNILDKVLPKLEKTTKNIMPVDYGPMAGFKRPLDNKGNQQGYYDVDDKSKFWQTDAGYKKAIQTWGNSGTLPSYVKRPGKKELDIDKIKKFFKIVK